MALLNLCGWEAGDSSEVHATGGTVSVQASVVRTGGFALRTNPTTTGTGFHDLRKFDGAGSPINLNEATLYGRFSFQYLTAPAATDEPMCEVQATGPATKFELRLNSSGQVVAYDSAGLALGTGATVLTSGTWYRIEVSVGTGALAAWEVKINGTSELSGTAAVGTNNSQRFRLGKPTNRNGNSVDFYYDDVVLSNSGYPGAGQIEVMVPDGDGTDTAWTIGAGSGADWQQVDEIPHDGNTTYLVSTLVVNDAETVTLESAASAGISGTIAAVKPMIIHRRDGAANGTISMKVRSGATAPLLSSVATTAALNPQMTIYETDPDTSAAWTTGGLDGFQVGIAEQETVDKSRWSAGYAMVDFVPAAAGGARVPSRRLMLLGVGA